MLRTTNRTRQALPIHSFSDTTRQLPPLNNFPACSMNLYPLPYMVVGSYLSPIMRKNKENYSHTVCRHLSWQRALKTEWTAYFWRHHGFVRMLSQSKGWIQVTWPSQGFPASLFTKITSMVDHTVDSSILADISLWYKDPEVSKLVYLLLKDCGHLWNPNLRPVIKLQQSDW